MCKELFYVWFHCALVNTFHEKNALFRLYRIFSFPIDLFVQTLNRAFCFQMLDSKSVDMKFIARAAMEDNHKSNGQTVKIVKGQVTLRELHKSVN